MVDALYHVSYASDVSNLKEEPIVEEDLYPSLQEVLHDIFSLKSEEKDLEITHFSGANPRRSGLTYL
jgi:hypothetical protein